MPSPDRRISLMILTAALLCAAAWTPTAEAQPQRGGVRSVTIPITIRQRGGDAVQRELQQVGDLTVLEDGDEQKILSIRAYGTETPISVGILIQDDVVSSISNEIKALREFVNRLPRGSRVMVGYIKSGSLDVRQRFTADLERAAESLRVPIGSASAAAYNPYVEIVEGLRRFEAMPKGRRALLVVTDGLDISRGVDSSLPSQSVDLQRAIREAQRQGVAVYSFYAPSVTASTIGRISLISNGQSSLELLADETGGRAFFQGTGAPVSFDPFLRDLAGTLTRQLALTYLSTHPKKGYHRIKVTSNVDGVEIEHPAGYRR
ncbi:MAG TPA: VWA domain-containing protein [Pyrinomonadaceae bacterium]|nr:VWA domain-containing protein [Pyrinomonadaceae bacterium]